MKKIEDLFFLSQKFCHLLDCRAVEIRADAFRAVDPDSLWLLEKYK